MVLFSPTGTDHIITYPSARGTTAFHRLGTSTCLPNTTVTQVVGAIKLPPPTIPTRWEMIKKAEL